MLLLIHSEESLIRVVQALHEARVVLFDSPAYEFLFVFVSAELFTLRILPLTALSLVNCIGTVVCGG